MPNRIVLHRVLIGINMTDVSRRAFYAGIELANKWGAEVYVMHVSEPIRSYDWGKKAYVETAERVDRIEQGVAQRIDMLWAEGGLDAVDRRRIHTIIQGGAPEVELVKAANDKAVDLIVLGRGNGHVAERVVRNAPCSVLCYSPISLTPIPSTHE
jgi:nucleotide-binding universal stress UspA family protein